MTRRRQIADRAWLDVADEAAAPVIASPSNTQPQSQLQRQQLQTVAVAPTHIDVQAASVSNAGADQSIYIYDDAPPAIRLRVSPLLFLLLPAIFFYLSSLLASFTVHFAGTSECGEIFTYFLWGAVILGYAFLLGYALLLIGPKYEGVVAKWTAVATFAAALGALTATGVWQIITKQTDACVASYTYKALWVILGFYGIFWLMLFAMVMFEVLRPLFCPPAAYEKSVILGIGRGREKLPWSLLAALSSSLPQQQQQQQQQRPLSSVALNAAAMREQLEREAEDTTLSASPTHSGASTARDSTAATTAAATAAEERKRRHASASASLSTSSVMPTAEVELAPVELRKDNFFLSAAAAEERAKKQQQDEEEEKYPLSLPSSATAHVIGSIDDALHLPTPARRVLPPLIRTGSRLPVDTVTAATTAEEEIRPLPRSILRSPSVASTTTAGAAAMLAADKNVTFSRDRLEEVRPAPLYVSDDDSSSSQSLSQQQQQPQSYDIFAAVRPAPASASSVSSGSLAFSPMPSASASMQSSALSSASLRPQPQQQPFASSLSLPLQPPRPLDPAFSYAAGPAPLPPLFAYGSTRATSLELSTRYSSSAFAPPQRAQWTSSSSLLPPRSAYAATMSSPGEVPGSLRSHAPTPSFESDARHTSTQQRHHATTGLLHTPTWSQSQAAMRDGGAFQPMSQQSRLNQRFDDDLDDDL